MKSNVIYGRVDTYWDKFVIFLDLVLPVIIEVLFEDSELEKIEKMLNLFAIQKCKRQIRTNKRKNPSAIIPTTRPISKLFYANPAICAPKIISIDTLRSVTSFVVVDKEDENDVSLR